MTNHIFTPRPELLTRLALIAVAGRALRAAIHANDQERIKAALLCLGEADSGEVVAWTSDMRARGFVSGDFLP